MNEKYLETGKIVSTHGIKGEVKVLPWADAPEFLLKFKTFYLVGTHSVRLQNAGPSVGASIACPQTGEPSSSGEGGSRSGPDEGRIHVRVLTVESARVQKTCVLVKFKGIDTVEDAAKLRERVICIARDDPHIPAGTVFHADLIGLPVRARGVEIGTIREILSMPSSDVWVVKGEKEYMIPHVKAFVPAIDLSLGYIDVNLIEGMETNEN